MNKVVKQVMARIEEGDKDASRKRIASQVAQRILAQEARSKTAGEIRFVKDNGPEQREIPEDFNFQAKHVKPMAQVLRSLSCAMGHLNSGQSRFTKIKSVNISPDGRLGGKGYIQQIKDIRTNLAAAIETISNTIDTLHDEIRADHWTCPKKDLSEKDQKEVDELISDSEEILEDPEAYHEQEYQDNVIDDIKEK